MNLHNRLSKLEKIVPRDSLLSRCEHCGQGRAKELSLTPEQRQRFICDRELREALIQFMDDRGDVLAGYRQTECPGCRRWVYHDVSKGDMAKLETLSARVNKKFRRFCKARGWPYDEAD